MLEIKIGDFVKVVSGPAYAGPMAQTIKGHVEEVTPIEGDAEVMVRVASGGLWGFHASNLKRLSKRAGMASD